MSLRRTGSGFLVLLGAGLLAAGCAAAPTDILTRVPDPIDVSVRVAPDAPDAEMEIAARRICLADQEPGRSLERRATNRQADTVQVVFADDGRRIDCTITLQPDGAWHRASLVSSDGAPTGKLTASSIEFLVDGGFRLFGEAPEAASTVRLALGDETIETPAEHGYYAISSATVVVPSSIAAVDAADRVIELIRGPDLADLWSSPGGTDQ